MNDYGPARAEHIALFRAELRAARLALGRCNLLAAVAFGLESAEARCLRAAVARLRRLAVARDGGDDLDSLEALGEFVERPITSPESVL